MINIKNQKNLCLWNIIYKCYLIIHLIVDLMKKHLYKFI